MMDDKVEKQLVHNLIPTVIRVQTVEDRLTDIEERVTKIESNFIELEKEVFKEYFEGDE